MRHRVLLVREWDAQVSGSGCCGRLGGIHTELGEPDTYAHTRCDMEAMGEVYRAIHAAFGDDEIELTVVDPRNMIWLVPSIWRDARRRGMTRGEAWRQVSRGVANGAVIVDGRVVCSRGIPTPEEALAAVREELAVG
jgi:hypothetical protein